MIGWRAAAVRYVPFCPLSTDNHENNNNMSLIGRHIEACEFEFKDSGCVDRSGRVQIKTGIKDTMALLFENMCKNIYVNK
jgi:hypothetical protein